MSGGFFTGTRDTEEVILSGCAREDPSRLGSLETAASDSDPSSSSPSFFWLLRSSSIWEAGGCHNRLPGDTQFYRAPSASWVFFFYHHLTYVLLFHVSSMIQDRGLIHNFLEIGSFQRNRPDDPGYKDNLKVANGCHSIVSHYIRRVGLWKPLTLLNSSILNLPVY